MAKKSETENFGEHFMLDGYGGDFGKLNSKDTVLDTLSELVERLGMRKLSKPIVYFSEGNDTKDPGGWSGVILIMESHISVHTFPARGFVTADVYSCKNGMDTKLIENFLKKQFELKEAETHLVKRGTKYPSHSV